MHSPGGAPPSSPRLAAAAVAVTSAIVAIAVARWSTSWVPTTDWALIEAQVRSVGRHLPLLGAPSADGFHHPGPLLYLALAPLYRLFGADPHALALSTGTLAVATTAGIGLVSWRRGGALLTVLAMAMVAWLAGSFEAGMLVDPWNPWTAVLPYLLFLLLVWSVCDGDLWALPAAVVVGSFVVQGHVGYLPSVAALMLLCCAAVVHALWRPQATDQHPSDPADARPGGRPPSVTRPLIAAALVAAVCWAGPVVDQLTRSPGNVRRGWWRFTDSAEAGRLGIDEGVGLMAGTSGWRAPWLGFAEQVDPVSLQVEPASWWHLSLPVAMVALMWWWGGRTRSLVWLASVTTTALVAAVGSLVLLDEGRAYPYVVRFTWVVAALTVLAAAWAGVSRLLATRPHLSRPLVGAALALLALASVRLVVSSGDASLPVYQPLARSIEVECLDQLLPDVVAEVGGSSVHLTAREFWPVSAAGIFNELERAGTEVAVEERLGFFVHRAPTQPRADQVQLVVVAEQALAAWEQRTDAVEVASCDLLDVDERAEFDRLEATGARDPFEGGRFVELVPRSRRTVIYRIESSD